MCLGMDYIVLIKEETPYIIFAGSLYIINSFYYAK